MSNNSKVTIKEVAKAANVSVATVSYVINNVPNMVSDDTRQKVLNIIEELGYVPNITARSLVKKESKLIGVVFPKQENLKFMVLRENPFYLEFISGIEYKALEHGYNTLLVGVEDEKQCKDILNSRNYAGLVTFDFIDKGVYKVLEQADIPVVTIEDIRVRDNNMCYLNSDNEKGGYLAAEHLIKKGHKKMFIYTVVLGAPVVSERVKGFKKACQDHNLKPDDICIMEDDDLNHITSEIVKGGYTAVFCIGDILAMYLMKDMQKKGIRVPEDVSVIGYDDIASCQFLMPALTTIKQDIYTKGAKAVDIILHNIANSASPIKDCTMTVELIERESVLNMNKE